MFKRISKSSHDIHWSIAILLLVPLWIGLSPLCYDTSQYCKWMSEVYVVLNENWIANLPICLVLLWLTYLWSCKILKDKDIRVYRAAIVVAALCFLNSGVEVDYANIIGNFSYRNLLNCLSLWMWIIVEKHAVSVYDFRQQGKRLKNKVKKAIGFTTDAPISNEAHENTKNYAHLVSERLLETDLSKMAYAVGVTGEWGVGKTSFLNVLRDEISPQSIVVDFNPWMCRTPEQVTHDFFASLRKRLAPEYSSLSKSIRSYAKYVNYLMVSAGTTVRFNLVPPEDESLYSKKEKLSAKFARLPRPVVVFIDDIDRMERDEVFEVLRLIRNTADLQNMIYVVAYDKEYVTGVLNEKNIKDAAAYLEKIFTVELHLPKVDEYLVWETLFADIQAQDNLTGNFAKRLRLKFNDNDRQLILSVANNYRRAKRLARILMLNMSYIYQHYKYEVRYSDLFWLELLQTYDKATYDILANDKFRLLIFENNRLIVKKDIFYTEEKNGKPERIFCKPKTPEILERLFGYGKKTIKQSICFIENYDKYFAISVSPYKLSVAELNELLKDESNPETVIKKWLDSNKYFTSIEYQLGHVDTRSLSDVQLEKLLSGILIFQVKASTHNYVSNQALRNKTLQKDYCDRASQQKAHDILIKLLKAGINDGKEIPAITRMLKNLYATEIYDDNGRLMEGDQRILSNQEIEELLTRALQTYLEKHHNTSALDVMKKDSEIFRVFKNCCVEVTDMMATEGTLFLKQTGFETIIKHFSQRREKPTKEEFEEAQKNLYYIPEPDTSDDEEMQRYMDYLENQYEDKMQETFGSHYGKDLESFKSNCFVHGVSSTSASAKPAPQPGSPVLHNNRRRKSTRQRKRKK